MNRQRVYGIIKWIIPVLLLLVHIIYIQKLYMYNLRIALHWACYLLLFFYLIFMGEIRMMFCELRQSIGKLSFVVKGIVYFLAAFICAMLIVFYFARDLNVMYSLWQPLSQIGLVVWAIGYIFLQPLVDNIIYHKWVLGNGRTESSKVLIIVVAMLRTFVETGIVIYSKNTGIPEEGFLALALWIVMCVFAISYVVHKNLALTYTIEVMYRIALVMTVFLGMSQFYIPALSL